MKIKLLATLASVLLTGTMLAQNSFTAEGASRHMLENVTINPDKQPRKPVAKQKNVTTSSEDMLTPRSMKITSMQKVAELDGSPVKPLANGNIYNIEGQYTLTIGDYYNGNQSKGVIDISVTISYDPSDGYYWIEEDNENYFFSPVPFNFNNDKLSFFQVRIGEIWVSYNQYFCLFTPFYYSWSLNDAVIQSTMTASFDKTNGVITFPEDNGFEWAAYTNRNYTGFAGTFEVFDVIKGKQKGEGQPAPTETWNNIGTAVFMDGWLLPGYSVDQKNIENWYEVPVQQSSDNPNKYRLVDPYKYGLLATTGTNTSRSTGYIVFDVSDPDHVLFDTNTEAGYTDLRSNLGVVYCYDLLSWAMAYLNCSMEVAMGRLTQPVPYTTYRYGVVDLNSAVRNGDVVYASVFGDQTDNIAGKSWVGCDMTGRIILPEGVGLGFINNTARVSNISDKTATVSFDFKSYHLTSAHKVYVNFSDGKGYNQSYVIDGSTHADVNLEGLQPLTRYTMTLTLDAKSGNSTVATSFPTTVTFTTLEEIVIPEPEIDAPTYVMVGSGDTIDLSSYFAEVEVAAWTSTHQDIATVANGIVTGEEYGEATVTAKNAKGEELASIKVFVCPVLTVLYPEGVETSHLVAYNSPIDVKLVPTDGWKVNTATIEGLDITTQVDDDNHLISNLTVKDDILINVVTASTANPTWADKIRISVHNRMVYITGVEILDNVNITNYKGDFTVYDWNIKEIPFSEGGVFRITITNYEKQEDAYFMMVVTM